MRCFLCLLIVLIYSGDSLYAQGQPGGFPDFTPFQLSDAYMDYDDGIDPMQSRLFSTTSLREQINLSGFWEFIADPDEKGDDDKYYESWPAVETLMWVPGTWNSTARHWQYIGQAWYRRTVEMPESGNLRLRFGGIFYYCEVWLDGNKLGSHEGGYLPFEFIIPNLEQGDHSLIVKVNSKLSTETVPKYDTDWFPYGGIYRPVYAEIIPDIRIQEIKATPEIKSDKMALVKVQVSVSNISKRTMTRDLTLILNGKAKQPVSVKCATGISKHDLELEINGCNLWSPETPYLYSLGVEIGQKEDDQFTRIGIRSFSKDSYKLFLNDEPFKFMGVNHHDDQPDWGSALPPEIIKKDIEIIKALNANGIRGHYPPSELLLDFCDQSGLVFFNEIPAWQLTPQMMANPVVKQKMKDQFVAMVDRDYNHPCIFCWSIGNEWREMEKSFDDIKEVLEFAQDTDSTHFVTLVKGGANYDKSFEYSDLYTTNWGEYEWYEGPTVPDSTVARARIERLEAIHRTLPDHPIILSEMGGAGSQAGWHNWGNVKWSEEYQAINTEESAKFSLFTEWMSGGFVWQFCDTRSAPTRILSARLRGWNVKGIVDNYRHPKMSYYKLQELYKNYQEQNTEK
jgi:beta-glucuronidase